MTNPTPGCEAVDFAGFPAGNIVLVSRGGCTFAIKATKQKGKGNFNLNPPGDDHRHEAEAE
jgi:hypothetical protein